MHSCITTVPQHLPSSLQVFWAMWIISVLWGQEQMFLKLHRIALCRYCASRFKNLVLSAFVPQKDDILHFACQSDDCWGSEALFNINLQHNAAHTSPLSLGQDYETEAECIPELNLTGRQGCQVADSNLNMSVVSRSLRAVEGSLYILISKWYML